MFPPFAAKLVFGKNVLNDFTDNDIFQIKAPLGTYYPYCNGKIKNERVTAHL